MTSKLKGGKTPPRLLEDLALYNPDRLPSKTLYNVLADLPPPFDGKSAPPKKIGKGACQHKWTLKSNSCSPFFMNTESGPAQHVVAALCFLCRCHVHLVITREEEDGVSPCPTRENPLHHFLYLAEESAGLTRTTLKANADSWEDIRLFQCSTFQCSARLAIHMYSPRLVKDWAELLTDKTAIARRAEAAMASDPSRFEGHAAPSPLTIMGYLRLYLATAMKGEHKRILSNNKKWMLSLGEPCRELLEYLRFTFNEEEIDPPRPDTSEVAPYSNELNILLDDVDNELAVLISQQPDEEKHIRFTPAINEFQNLLSCKNYDTSPSFRTVDLTQDIEDEHPFYAGLGAILDFHDNLLVFAYERQIGCDVGNTPYYLECLQGISKGRSEKGSNSDELQTRVVIEESSGKVSLQDIRNAYAAFGLDMNSPYDDEDHIIGTFQSRVADSSRQEPELRRALNVIGQHRDSFRIQQFASDTVSTYEQALLWLGATEGMDDSFLVGENAANEKQARECVSLIADKRNSEALRQWLQTGELMETEMDFGQAYARLDIMDRTVEDELVFAAYNSAVQDTPSQMPELRRALLAIAKDRKSNFLHGCLDGGMVNSDRKLSEWPVGLENIGNTCYLNSLLQFYFTIRPLRDLVLHVDEHLMDIETTVFRRKQVGSRSVSKKEVERAQKFVAELQKLFRNMISADRASVTPEQELARLTLLSSSTEEHIRRRSTLNGPRPSLGDIDGFLVHGPLPPPVPTSFGSNAESVTVAGEKPIPVTVSGDSAKNTDEEDASSDGTLVEKPSTPAENDYTVIDPLQMEKPQHAFENKENMIPSEIDGAHPASPESVLIPLAESSPSRVNEQRNSRGSQKSTSRRTSPAKSVAKAEPPSRPPPVPPRDKPEDKKAEVQREVEIGAQQDVTEAISNVLFQLQCAIRAEYVDDSGEQIDLVKKLFFGKQKITTTAIDGNARTKEEFFSDIKVQVSSGPQDIYSALDAAFDEQEVEVGTSKEPQYTTVSVLPPILQIHVARALFDNQKGTVFKSNHHLDFKEVIYLDRYMDTDDAEFRQKRRERWALKKELARFEKRESELKETKLGTSMSETLGATAEYLKQLQTLDADDSDPVEIRPGLLTEIEAASVGAQEELEDLGTKIRDLIEKLKSQFADLQSLPYRLHSVFIHRGMVSSGHYWIYIYDFAARMWRKYNDGYVTEVKDPKEVYETEDSGRPATASYLVYVKEGMEEELTEAVFRNVVEPRVENPWNDGLNDVVMLDSPVQQQQPPPSDQWGSQVW